MKPFYTNIQQVGNKFWLRFQDDDGRDVTTWVSDYCPTMYIKTNEKTEYLTTQGEYLKAMPTDGVKHAREMLKRYEGVNGFELYGNPLWQYSYLFEAFGHRLEYDHTKIHCAIIDIETRVGENSIGFPYPWQAAEELTLITHLYKGEYHIFAVKDFDIEKYNTIGLKTFKHVFQNEDDMLRGYMSFWQGNYPHAVSGWNVESFDLGYIINRIRQRLGDSWVTKLSPIGQIQLEFMEDDPTKLKKLVIRGVEILDYMLMYKKYSPGERDFSLDSFAEDFLKENKVENPTGSSFKAFYSGEWEQRAEPQNDIQRLAYRRTELKSLILNSDDPALVREFETLDRDIKKRCWDMFVWYNVRDVDIVKRLDDVLGMLNLTYTISYLVGMNYSDVFGTVKPWDIFLQNELAVKNQFLSTVEKHNVMPRKLMGGFVHLYKAGLYRDGVTLDATSLYPSIMMCLNLGPETILDEDDVPPELMKYYDRNLIQEFLDNGFPPELEETLKKYNLAMSMNGMFFDRSKKSFIAETVSDVFGQRKAEKKLMLNYEDELEKVEIEIKELETDKTLNKDRLNVLYQSQDALQTKVNIHHNTQLALKTLMNALYGAMGNEYFRHFNFYIAEAITSTGQFGIRYNTRVVDQYINKLCGTNEIHAIYNDTDSISISLQGVIDKMKVDRNNPNYIDAVCEFADKKVNKQTEVACADIARTLNFFENKLSFKREKVFLAGLYVVKKRYALLVVDEEGVRFGEPKVKITGLEIKRSDSPKICRDAMKDGLMIILKGTESEFQKYVSEFETKFRTFDPVEIALPSGVQGLKKNEDRVTIYKKGCPMHVRASLIYNKALKDMGLMNDYTLIAEGSKMKYLKLRMPNTVKSDVVGFSDVIPKEFDIHQYVDYDKMFEDTFAKGMRRMADAAGWSMQFVSDVDDWF